MVTNILNNIKNFDFFSTNINISVITNDINIIQMIPVENNYIKKSNLVCSSNEQDYTMEIKSH